MREEINEVREFLALVLFIMSQITFGDERNVVATVA